MRNKGETDLVPVGVKNVAEPGYTVLPKLLDVGNEATLASTPEDAALTVAVAAVMMELAGDAAPDTAAVVAIGAAADADDVTV